MKINKKISKIGNSYYILIPNKIRKKFKIGNGDTIELVMLGKTVSLDQSDAVFKCLNCNHYFNDREDNEKKICIKCGEKNNFMLVKKLKLNERR